jgi:hypothetical protein
MNRQQALELLPIMKAFAEGGEVQARQKGVNNAPWITHAEYDWRLRTYEYRIKPKKLHPEIEYVYVIPASLAWPHSRPCSSLYEDIAKRLCPAGVEVIKFKRVED